MQNYKKTALHYIVTCLVFCCILNMQAKACKKAKLIKKALTVCGTLTARCGIIDKNQAFGSFFNATNGTFVDTNNAVPFTNDSVPPHGMSHDPAPFSAVTILKSGVYYTAYKVRTQENFVISTALFRNGVQIPGTDDSGFTTTVDNLLFSANAGDIITLRNTGPAFTAMSFSGSTTPITLVLVRVSPNF